MLDYLRSVRGSKEAKKEAAREPEAVDTASLITALHPFANGGH